MRNLINEAVRKTHEKIVKMYIPDDDQLELADALFKWKHSK